MRGWTGSPGSSRRSAEPEAMKLYMLDLRCLRHRSRVGVVGVKDSCGMVVSRCCSRTQGESVDASPQRAPRQKVAKERGWIDGSGAIC